MAHKCWFCDGDLRWDGDHDYEESDDYDVVSCLTCTECGTHVEFFHAKQ